MGLVCGIDDIGTDCCSARDKDMHNLNTPYYAQNSPQDEKEAMLT